MAGLDPKAAQSVRERFASAAAAGGGLLFEQGEEGDALYTLTAMCWVTVRARRSPTKVATS